MKATVAFNEPTTGTIYPQLATGTVIRALISKDPLDGGSIAILTDERGHRNLNTLLAGEKPTVRVRDLLTGSVHTLERADCGLGCRCACRIVKSSAN